MKRAHRNTEGMFKTSISMPGSLLSVWTKRRLLIDSTLPGLLTLYANRNPRRDRLVQYTHASEPCSRVSVYWHIEVYNELHSVASSLRISVSHLLCLILQFLESGGSAGRTFLKYAFTVNEWSQCRMHCTEILEFTSDNPDPP